ncbi:MAG: hypothetical protein ACT4QA_14650 [Panacagrimonas sp.]
MNVAVALNGDGSVQAVGLISSDLGVPEFERIVMIKTGTLQFGPASGEGFYVFWYPIKSA